VHGGVRYLQQLNLTLVVDALRERGHMLRNAPHLVHDLSFVVPAYNYCRFLTMVSGSRSMRCYQAAVAWAIGVSLRKTTLEKLPDLGRTAFEAASSIDGQFDDARYAIALLRTFRPRWHRDQLC